VQPWDSLVFAITVVVAVLVNGKTMLTRDAAVTEVLMPGEAGAPDAAHVPAYS
jgi:hypothetical protein